MSVASGCPLAFSGLRAWALTGLVASIAACGGNVVVDPAHGAVSTVSSSTGTDTGTGAGGSISTSTSTTITGNGGGVTGDTTGVGGSTSSGALFDGGPCSPVVAPPQMVEMACFQSTFCPQTTDASTQEQLTATLGFCNQEKIPCCGKTVIDHVECGPVKQGPNCCYAVVYSTFQCGD